MIVLTLAEVASAVDGVLHGSTGPEVVTGGVEVDSRRVGLLAANPVGVAAVLGCYRPASRGQTEVVDRTDGVAMVNDAYNVLIKMSRAVGLERIAEGLLSAPDPEQVGLGEGSRG